MSIVILAVRILSFTMMMFVFHGTVTVSVERKRRQVKQPNVRQRHNQRAERVKNGHRQKFVIHQRKKRS